MLDPNRNPASGTAALRQRGRAAHGRTAKLRAAISAFLFCLGLMLLPALAALDLSVGLGCRDLDRAACIGLFLTSTEQP